MADYFTVKDEAYSEFVEKKSRFIGYIKPCATEKDAIDFVNSIKKKHSDARHNVYAYVLRENNKQRYSDDGEPQGTGGLPVLEVILKKGLTDVCVVVTRYFGGILLGTGGLTRAYSQGCKDAIDASGVVQMCESKCFTIECDYGVYNTLQSIFANFDVVVKDSDFGSNVKLDCYIKTGDYQTFTNELTERFSGKVVPIEKEIDYFAYLVK